VTVRRPLSSRSCQFLSSQKCVSCTEYAMSRTRKWKDRTKTLNLVTIIVVAQRHQGNKALIGLQYITMTNGIGRGWKNYIHAGPLLFCSCAVLEHLVDKPRLAIPPTAVVPYFLFFSLFSSSHAFIQLGLWVQKKINNPSGTQKINESGAEESCDPAYRHHEPWSLRTCVYLVRGSSW